MSELVLREQLEYDLAWRRDEMRFLGNILADIREECLRDCYRKSLVVMLYAHYEGFCKVAFLAYAAEVNELGVECCEAAEALAAASLADLFRALDNPSRKCAQFQRKLPDDAKLHRLARQAEFISAMGRVGRGRVSIPARLVDTEDNLKPIVMSKILFQLGLPHDAMSQYEGSIDMLLNRRNSVAHGERRKGLSASEYSAIERATYEVMDEAVRVVTRALSAGQYLRESEPTGLAGP